MAAFLCTPISLFIMSMAHTFCMPGNGAPGLTYQMVIPEGIVVVLCFWWRLTENEVLYVWLPMALIACSPFGLFFLSLFF